MADVNQTRAALAHQLAGTPYRLRDTTIGMRVEYEPITDSFASDANQAVSKQVYGLNIDLQPANVRANLTRLDSESTRAHYSGPLIASQQVSKSVAISSDPGALVQPGDPQEVRAMVNLVTAVIAQHGWVIGPSRQRQTMTRLVVILVVGALVMVMILGALIFVLRLA